MSLPESRDLFLAQSPFSSVEYKIGQAKAKAYPSGLKRSCVVSRSSRPHGVSGNISSKDKLVL